MTTGVHVEMAGVMANIDEAMDLITAKDREIMRYGRKLMKMATRRAFREKADPGTGKPWAQRKGSYPWPLLRNTSNVWNSLGWSYGIKTKDKRLKFFGKVKDTYYSGGYTRGGGQKPTIVVVGSIHYGRTKARSRAGTRVRGPGGFVSPSTGKTPARPLFGFGRSQQKRIKRFAEKRIAKVFR